MFVEITLNYMELEVDFRCLMFTSLMINYAYNMTLRTQQQHSTRLVIAVIVSIVLSVIQSCLTLCDPMDCRSPDSSVHGILQARILEWVAIPFSRGSSQPRDRTQVSCTAGRFFPTGATREEAYLVRNTSKDLFPISLWLNTEVFLRKSIYSTILGDILLSFGHGISIDTILKQFET